MEEILEPSPMTRKKQDLAWKHCQMFKEGKKTYLKCIYCGKMFKGGGIHRLKEHLAGRKGGGPMCRSVPPDVRLWTQQYLDGVIGKQNSHQLKILEEASIVNLPSSEEAMLSNPLGNFEGTPGTRRKKDVGWKHCEMLRNEKRVQIKCNYCAKLFKGGGIHRFKEHLAGRNSSGVRICTRVPSDVRGLMLQHLSPIVAWQRKKRKSREEKLHNAHSLPRGEDSDIFADHSDDVNTSLEASAGCNLAESRGSKTTSAIAPAAAHDADDLMALGLEKADNAIHATMGRFLYDIGASLDALDSSFFQPLIDAVFSGRSGVAAPSHQDFRGRILKSLVQEVKSDIEQYKTRWAKTGCSLLVEEWDSGSGVDGLPLFKATWRIINVLGTVRSEKRAAMGYVLSGIYRAKESIKRELVKREDYMVYWNILDHRWEQQWKTPLHAAVQDKIVKELNLYKNAEGDLGRKMAIRARDTLLPELSNDISFLDSKPTCLACLLLFGAPSHLDSLNGLAQLAADWWSTYGGACPNLARLAIRILSQTCSSIGCSHNHIHLEKVYRTRNCLQHQRLSDLVFVQYNLRLRQMVDGNKKQIPEDPVSFDDISIIEDWITQNEPSLEDDGSSDWMSLVPPSVNTMPLVPSTDESEDVATGFDDFEIFNGLNEVRDVK
ncbi:hypothetical protein OIU74_002756 [Salix koriyanagi]|uniref:BED-type domain-containing protein n=1 Tax=Salix koriyanagi TaxID=2511006 RepID=A0A9Q0X4A6_9ROSI|nr:hypothetical protein OIU74_002756 [Salix koriyanagi]